MAADPEMQRFLNRLKILRSLERDELLAAGYHMTAAQWFDFSTGPERHLFRADDPTQAAIWAAMLAREIQ